MIDKFYEYYDLAVTAAKKAGDFLAKRENIEIKANFQHDMKISSDIASEKIILDILAPSNIPLLSEESGLSKKADSLLWIIDPLDGTINYYKNNADLCAISIALYMNNEPLFGIVNRFNAGELFTGITGKGAFLNDNEIKTSTITEMKNAVLATGFPSGLEHSDVKLSSLLENVKHAKKIRMLGTAAIMCTYVACGRFDIYTEDSIRLWDIAAAAAIVKAAGGCYSLKNMVDDGSYRCDFAGFANEKLKANYFETKGDIDNESY